MNDIFTKERLHSELSETLDRYDYPKEAKIAVLSALETLFENDLFSGFIRDYLEPYSREETFDYSAFLAYSKKVSEISGISPYLCGLFFCLLLVPYAEPFYKKAGVSQKVYEDSMRDILFKTYECMHVKGEVGVFHAFWFDRWFNGTRFAFGRLEFETSHARCDVKVGEFDIREGDLWISVHIPSDAKTPLSKENCDAAYDMARKFYAPLFPDGKVIFRCSSWMLHPAHQTILPETSNIRRFASEYTTIGNLHETSEDLWRIFGSSADPFTTVEALEERTSLQKIYKNYLRSGGVPGGISGLKY